MFCERPNNAEYWPPSLTLTLAIALIVGSGWVYVRGQMLGEWGPLISLALGVVGGYQIIKAWNDWDAYRDYRRRVREFDKAAKQHGEAGLATVDQIDQSEDFA